MITTSIILTTVTTQLRESVITLGQFRWALKMHLFGHWQLQRRVTVFSVRCVQICLLTYLLTEWSWYYVPHQRPEQTWFSQQQAIWMMSRTLNTKYTEHDIHQQALLLNNAAVMQTRWSNCRSVCLQWKVHFWKMLSVTLTLNPWPWKCHQCHVDLIMSTVHSGYMHGLGTDASSCLYPEHAYKRS